MNIILLSMFRVGSNYTRSLLEKNYNVVVYYNSVGWKHGPVPTFASGSKLKYPDADKFKYLVVVKDPYATFVSWFEYIKKNGNNFKADTSSFSKFLRSPIIFYNEPQPNSPEYYFSSPVHMWNSMVWNHCSFSDKNNGYVIKYEDLLSNPEAASANIAEHFGLSQVTERFEVIERRVKNMGDSKIKRDEEGSVTKKEFNKKEYFINKEYLVEYSRADLDFVRKNLSNSLLSRFGYEFITPSFSVGGVFGMLDVSYSASPDSIGPHSPSSNEIISFYWDDISTLPLEYKENIEIARSIHFKHKVFVFDSCAGHAEVDKVSSGLSKHYDEIKIPAAKSDIARLAILYNYGGWYLDCDMKLCKDLSVFPQNKPVFFSRDDLSYERVMNGSMFFPKPNHPLLKDCLRLIEMYLDSGIYNFSVWNCTGPGIINTYLDKYSLRDMAKPYTEFFKDKSTRIAHPVSTGASSTWMFMQAFGIKGDSFNSKAIPNYITDAGVGRMVSYIRKEKKYDFLKEVAKSRPEFLKIKKFKKLLDEISDGSNVV